MFSDIFIPQGIISSNLFAREKFEFSLGKSVHVLSDKAFRRSRENIFEAVGNVIITQQENAIYGDKATISFSSGDAEVSGNVRYIGPEATVYGSQLKYNFNNNNFVLSKARILADNYVVLGDSLSRIGPNTYVGENAEYTTCRDCPESWSIFGSRVHITVGNYIQIWKAYIKVNGVVVMFVPYIILPIKKDRETGLLFPRFGFELEEGAYYNQPWFWAISRSADLTLTPGIQGRRGWTNEFEYRQFYGAEKWFQVDSLQSWDRIYLPEKKDSKDQLNLSGTHTFRSYGEVEHHLTNGEHINHHFRYQYLEDLDMTRSFPNYLNDRHDSSDFGFEGFFDFRTQYTHLGVEGAFKRNQLFGNAKGFDHRYVQIVPEVSFGTTPLPILQPGFIFLDKLSLTLEGDLKVFKQNHTSENNYVRNATRTNLSPRLDWFFGELGPVSLKTGARLDYQQYKLPTRPTEDKFTKRGIVYESEMSFELEKVFGISYKEDISSDRLKLTESDNEKNEAIKEGSLIGKLPEISQKLSSNSVTVESVSYKHSSQWKTRHLYFASQKTDGNLAFANQIRNEAGQFDYLDALRDEQYILNDSISRTGLPIRNTIELQWNNSIIRKKANGSSLFSNGKYLRDNFSYQKVAYFDVSQGVDLALPDQINGDDTELNDRLTRLYLSTGLTVDRTSFSVSEYYFHQQSKHILSARVSQQFNLFDISTGLDYDSFTTPIKKYVVGDLYLRPLDIAHFKIHYDYDLEQKRTDKSEYTMIYSPLNNCWKLEFGFARNLFEKRYSFNFLVNFNENSFRSFNQK